MVLPGVQSAPAAREQVTTGARHVPAWQVAPPQQPDDTVQAPPMGRQQRVVVGAGAHWSPAVQQLGGAPVAVQIVPCAREQVGLGAT